VIWSLTYNNSSKYGADEKEAFNPMFIDELPATHIEWRYVVANRAPVKPHGKVKSPIVILGGVKLFGSFSGEIAEMTYAVRQRREIRQG
jgi:hypothetical protein